MFQQLLRIMSKKTRNLPDRTQRLFIAKGLERAGDHMTDIAEEL
ncbi:PhoU domain-containing protein [Candidatus Nitrospira allomarina]|uniref:PhoU domain-containing protein n=1 Tax=Candidatus Nitrospira allomarina TaxID=3020900 RepID=A0AA96JQQ5_9BACT|nr:PhoU domain-containing protein [Candidatus Nitrospira allomarina]WNM56697.1 hypothetical protein PP769_11985 [Candidatus Nitrospira allomarina]